MNKTVKLILAVVFFIISYIEAKNVSTSRLISVKMDSIWNLTEYVWSLCPALLGVYLVWSAFMTKKSDPFLDRP